VLNNQKDLTLGGTGYILEILSNCELTALKDAKLREILDALVLNLRETTRGKF